MKNEAWLSVLALGVLVGCGGTGEGPASGSSPSGYSSKPPGGSDLPGSPFKPPGGGGEGGGGAQGGGGSGGGSGGGGGDCVSACQALASECGGSSAACGEVCAKFPNAGPCLSEANCQNYGECFQGGTGGAAGGGGAGGSGGTVVGGAGGMGGSVGGGGGLGGGGTGGGTGGCTYPNCGGCTDTCNACLCATQNDQTACASYCG